MIDIKRFKSEYATLTACLDGVVFGELSFEKAAEVCGAQFRADFGCAEAFCDALVRLIERYRRSVYMFYNMNGTINENEFLKFFISFLIADDVEKREYEVVNGAKYGALRDGFCKINEMINLNLALGRKKRNRPFDKVMQTRADRKSAREALVEIGREYAESVWSGVNIDRGNLQKYAEGLARLSKESASDGV